MVWIYGWKVHALVNVPTQLPVAFDVSLANENGSPILRVLRELVRRSKQDYIGPWTLPAWAFAHLAV